MKSGTKIRYLLDANVVIDYFGNRFTDSFAAQLEEWLSESQCAMSVVAGVEALAKNTDKSEQIVRLLETLPILDFTEDLMPLAASFCSQYKFKLPDALIAATALHHSYILVTSNKRSFQLLDQLSLIRPDVKEEYR